MFICREKISFMSIKVIRINFFIKAIISMLHSKVSLMLYRHFQFILDSE